MIEVVSGGKATLSLLSGDWILGLGKWNLVVFGRVFHRLAGLMGVS
jgi:hypothetical protein